MRGLSCFVVLALVACCACADVPECGPGSPIHIAHPTDCSKYYTCANGEAILQDCAPGLWWNVAIEGCDLPEHTDCAAVSSTTTAGTTTTSPIPTQDSTTTAQSTTTRTMQTTTTPAVLCGSGSPTHIPHPTDCSKYYTCDEGVAIEQTCPPGLWWSVAVEGCDFPENTVCASSSTPAATTTTGEPPIETTSGGPPVETTSGGPPVETTSGGPPVETTSGGPPVETTSGGPPVETTTQDNTDLPDCKGTSDTLLPHPTDCTKFYKCLEGTPILLTCPPGLWWHQDILACDWPNDSECTPGVTSGTTATAEPPTEA